MIAGNSSKPLKLTAERGKSHSFLRGTRCTWYETDGLFADRRTVPKHNLSRESRAEAILPRERTTADTLENGAFAYRLITTYDELWQLNMITNPKGSDAVNLVESFEGLGRTQSTAEVVDIGALVPMVQIRIPHGALCGASQRKL